MHDWREWMRRTVAGFVRIQPGAGSTLNPSELLRVQLRLDRSRLIPSAADLPNPIVSENFDNAVVGAAPLVLLVLGHLHTAA